MAGKAELIVEMDEAELAIRLCEANYGMKRPTGLNAREAMDAMEEDVREGWRQSAIAAIEYFTECVNAGKRPS